VIDKNKRLGYYNYCQQQNRAKRFKRCANSFLLDSTKTKQYNEETKNRCKEAEKSAWYYFT
jgi:hypothetical protein